MRRAAAGAGSWRPGEKTRNTVAAAWPHRCLPLDAGGRGGRSPGSRLSTLASLLPSPAQAAPASFLTGCPTLHRARPSHAAPRCAAAPPSARTMVGMYFSPSSCRSALQGLSGRRGAQRLMQHARGPGAHERYWGKRQAIQQESRARPRTDGRGGQPSTHTSQGSRRGVRGAQGSAGAPAYAHKRLPHSSPGPATTTTSSSTPAHPPTPYTPRTRASKKGTRPHLGRPSDRHFQA